MCPDRTPKDAFWTLKDAFWTPGRTTKAYQNQKKAQPFPDVVNWPTKMI